MKLRISETAWSIGKSLYNRTQEVDPWEDGRDGGKSANKPSSEPPSLRLSASVNLDHVRSYRIRWICEHVVESSTHRGKGSACRRTHGSVDVNRLLEIRFPARADFHKDLSIRSHVEFSGAPETRKS
jgi:hypothetical protein